MNSTATTNPTGIQAVNAALNAGFEIERHFAPRNVPGSYLHELRDAKGRGVYIYSQLGSGKFQKARATFPLAGGRRYQTTRLAEVLAALA